MRRRPRRSSRRVPDAGEVADRQLAARRPEHQQRLAVAVAALRQASLDRMAPAEIRARYRAVGDAFDAAIAAAEAGYRVALGRVDGLSHTQVIAARGRPGARACRRVLDQLRTARQQHLLSASPVWGGVLPDCERAAALSALGPFWPTIDYLPADVAYRRRVLPLVRA